METLKTCAFAAVAAAGIWTFGVPVVIGMAAKTGLTGAALTSSGLATLGGGSLASGGFGMAGGYTVLSALTAGVSIPIGAAAHTVVNRVLCPDTDTDIAIDEDWMDIDRVGPVDQEM